MKLGRLKVAFLGFHLLLNSSVNRECELPVMSAKHPSNKEIIEAGLESLEREHETVIECFREVLRSSPKPHLADVIGKQSAIKADPEDAARVMSVAFQLLDMVEERVSHEARHVRVESLGPEAEKGSWAHCLTTLKDKGVSEQDLIATIRDVRVEPVFTAHPTEAKRPSARERYRDVFRLLCECEKPNQTPSEIKRATNALTTGLEALWYTGELGSETPTVERELRNVLYYLRHVFPTIINEVDGHFIEAWNKFTDDPTSLEKVACPSIRFGLWIGGDRDGHPFVTADVTHNTLQELRSQAIKLYRHELAEVASNVSMCLSVTDAPQALRNRIEEIAELLGDEGTSIINRNLTEPWRGMCYLLRAKLLVDENPNIDEFKRDIEILNESLREIGAVRVAQQMVYPLLRKIDTFGFHLATLDIRQNSDFHDRAASELLSAAGIKDGLNFADWSEQKRIIFLNEQLQSNRPLIHPDRVEGETLTAVLDSLRTFAEQRRKHGQDAGLGALIVSMTRQVSDLLLIHLFAREAGLIIRHEGKEVCPLEVVPLFETLGDLEQASAIVASYFEQPIVTQSIDARAALEGRRSQQIMLGYSDSNKDAGILASQWALHKTQQMITDVAEQHNVTIRFFHGMGGTISRGAGPTNWFLRSLPHGSLDGDFRLTEQGETIARKYAYPENAAYHIETMLACVTRTSALHRATEANPDPGIESIEKLANWSKVTYRELLETDGFITFFREATPIDALEKIQIGSRPSRRTGAYSLDDLRAIPWVFSWTQSRFYLPGWYGVGSALEQLHDSCPDEYQTLVDTIAGSNLPRYLFTSVETNLLSADLKLMKQYCGLVEDTEVGDRFYSIVENELKRTKTHLTTLFSKPITERRPRYAKTLSLREQPLRNLHEHQIDLLREWRSNDSEELPRALALNISAIASGLRSTVDLLG